MPAAEDALAAGVEVAAASCSSSLSAAPCAPAPVEVAPSGAAPTLCSNSRRTKNKRRSNSMPGAAVAGRPTNTCQMAGMQSRARLPSTSGFVGTSRQHINCTPRFFKITSNKCMWRSRMRASAGKKNMPTPTSPAVFSAAASLFFTKPSHASASAKYSLGICNIMPTPSPV